MGPGNSAAPLWIGLAAGSVIQFRSDSLLTVWIGLVAISLFVPWSEVRRTGSLLRLGIPMVVGLGALATYNEIRYHRLFVESYGQGQGLHNPIAVGLHGLLWSWGKGLFVFNPLAVLGVVGLVLLWRSNRPLTILFLLLIVTRTLFFSKWSVWDGGWCWGPRFLPPILPLLMISAVEVLRETNRQELSGIIVRAVAMLLVVLSAAINLVSVRTPVGQWLGVLAVPSERARFGIRGLHSAAAQNNAYDFHLPDGPLWGTILLVRHRVAVEASDLWLNHDGLVGGLLVLIGALCLLAAFRGGQSSGRHSRRGCWIRAVGSAPVDGPATPNALTIAPVTVMIERSGGVHRLRKDGDRSDGHQPAFSGPPRVRTGQVRASGLRALRCGPSRC